MNPFGSPGDKRTYVPFWDKFEGLEARVSPGIRNSTKEKPDWRHVAATEASTSQVLGPRSVLFLLNARNAVETNEITYHEPRRIR